MNNINVGDDVLFNNQKGIVRTVYHDIEIAIISFTDGTSKKVRVSDLVLEDKKSEPKESINQVNVNDFIEKIREIDKEFLDDFTQAFESIAVEAFEILRKQIKLFTQYYQKLIDNLSANNDQTDSYEVNEDEEFN